MTSRTTHGEISFPIASSSLLFGLCLDCKTNRLIFHPSAHYAQSLWRHLKFEETSELAQFLVDSLLRDDGLVNYAKQSLGNGGMGVLSKYVADQGMFENYVKHTVVSQLEIK
jgi:hypothetical protein